MINYIILAQNQTLANDPRLAIVDADHCICGDRRKLLRWRSRNATAIKSQRLAVIVTGNGVTRGDLELSLLGRGRLTSYQLMKCHCAAVSCEGVEGRKSICPVARECPSALGRGIVAPDNFARKVCFVITKAREFDAKDAVTEPDPGSNPSDDHDAFVLEDHDDAPVVEEVTSLINSSSEDK